MSKFKPEVGDVFSIVYPEYTVLATVIDVTRTDVTLFRRYKYDFENRYRFDTSTINKLIESDYYNIIFNKRATYLGKSKANIDDLFKTENEE